MSDLIFTGIVSSNGAAQYSNQGDNAFQVSYDEIDYDDTFTGKSIKGTYSISYGNGSKGSTPFTVAPVVVATANYENDTSAHTRICTILDSDINGFIVYIEGNSGDYKQCTFNFIAIGTGTSQ